MLTKSYYRAATERYVRSFLFDSLVEGSCTIDDIRQLFTNGDFVRGVVSNIYQNAERPPQPGDPCQYGHLIAWSLVHDIFSEIDTDCGLDVPIFPKIKSEIIRKYDVETFNLVTGAGFPLTPDSEY